MLARDTFAHIAEGFFPDAGEKSRRIEWLAIDELIVARAFSNPLWSFGCRRRTWRRLWVQA